MPLFVLLAAAPLLAGCRTDNTTTTSTNHAGTYNDDNRMRSEPESRINYRDDRMYHTADTDTYRASPR